MFFKKKCPRNQVSVFSRVTHWWMTGLILQGTKQNINKEDLWEIDENELSESITQEVEFYWTKLSQK